LTEQAHASIKGTFSGHKELQQYITAHKETKSALKTWSSAQLNGECDIQV
jgi:hypothetical protein